MDQSRLEKLKYLNEAPTNELLQNLKYLTREQQKELHWQYLGRFYRFGLKTDDQDKKYINRIRNDFILLTLSVLPIRYIEQIVRSRTNNFRTLNPNLQRICRVSTMHRGVLIYFCLLCIASLDIGQNSYRIAYKHYIMDQYDKNN